MRQGLNYNHLESFLCVAKYLSFSKASRELNIAQPAISKQIKSLEGFFNQQLFIRSRQTVNLTPFGQEIVVRLGGLHNELGHRVEEIREFSSVLSGEIRLGCLSEVGEKVFIKVLSKFKKEYPDIQLHIQFLKGNEIVQNLKQGQLDIGIIADKVVQENIRCFKILDEEIIMIANRTTDFDLKGKINQLPFVAYSLNDPLLMSFLQKFSPRFQAQKLNFEFIVNSHRSMLEIIKERPYFCVVPRLSVEKELKAKTIVQVTQKSIKSSLYLIQQEQEFPERKVATLSTFLRKHKY